MRVCYVFLVATVALFASDAGVSAATTDATEAATTSRFLRSHKTAANVGNDEEERGLDIIKQLAEIMKSLEGKNWMDALHTLQFVHLSQKQRDAILQLHLERLAKNA
ncbi:hypothetical protein PHYPSEUDO_007553 [Phytophthora pseudosyringae]|uniref:RxLR effector protein n=1 Tax=Phytophthora pseudosyringae TaxID=221518 RepID=A0A8T1VJK6_9STRA|nr:hypothetical protein PHYPSEUDO_007553 [Phytophthora pseudosyringae]